MSGSLSGRASADSVTHLYGGAAYYNSKSQNKVVKRTSLFI
jgi:hypothetical protein